MTTPIDVIVNEPLEIWRDNCVLRDGVDYSQTCAITAGPESLRVYDHIEDRWRVFPTTTGDYTLQVSSGGLSDATTMHVVADLLGTEPGRSVVFYGDSITAAAGGFVQQVKDAIGAQLTLLGTQGVTYVHEGYSGKHWDWFRHHADSPLTSATDTLDIPAHLTALGATPDIALWNLGTNDLVTRADDDPSTWPGILDAMVDDIDQILAAYAAAASTVVHVLGFTWPGNQRHQPWIDTYAADIRWEWRQLVHLWWERLISEYGAREGDGIYLCANHLQIDPTNDYPAADPVHPGATTGHARTARATRHWLVAHWE